MILLALLFTVSFAPEKCYITNADTCKMELATCAGVEAFQNGVGHNWVAKGQRDDDTWIATKGHDCLEPDNIVERGYIKDAPSYCIYAKLMTDEVYNGLGKEKDCWRLYGDQDKSPCKNPPEPEEEPEDTSSRQQPPTAPSPCDEIDAEFAKPENKGMAKILELKEKCHDIGKDACKAEQSTAAGRHVCIENRSGNANRLSKQSSKDSQVSIGFSKSKNYISAGCFLAFVSVASYVLVKQCRANKDDYQTLMSDEDQL